MRTLLPALCLIVMTMTSCPGFFDDIGPAPFTFYTQYEPVMMKRAVMEQAVRVENARPIQSPAKIYVRGNYLFISERYQGIHIVNNTDPSTPLNQAFVRIPGCVDMAVKGDILYADNATDLIALNISNLSAIQVTSRVRNTFPETLPPDLGSLPEEYRNRPRDLIIVGWREASDN